MAENLMSVDAPCAHHWLLDTPNGSVTIHGVCHLCKAEKDFPAYYDEENVLSKNRKHRSISLQPRRMDWVDRP